MRKTILCFSASLDVLSGLKSSDDELLLPRWTNAWGGEFEICDAVRLYEPHDTLEKGFSDKGVPVEVVGAKPTAATDKPKKRKE